MNENKQSIDNDADFRKLLAEFAGAPDMEKWHSARAALIAHIDAQLARERKGDHDEAVRLLGLVFDAWENGDECYENGHPSSGAYMGMAFRLDDDVFHACCNLLNRLNPPRNAAPAAQAQGEPVAKPYAYEYGKSNGDGTYSVVIERGNGPPKNAIKDWPIKPLYTNAAQADEGNAK